MNLPFRPPPLLPLSRQAAQFARKYFYWFLHGSRIYTLHCTRAYNFIKYGREQASTDIRIYSLTIPQTRARAHTTECIIYRIRRDVLRSLDIRARLVRAGSRKSRR